MNTVSEPIFFWTGVGFYEGKWPSYPLFSANRYCVFFRILQYLLQRIDFTDHWQIFGICYVVFTFVEKKTDKQVSTLSLGQLPSWEILVSHCCVTQIKMIPVNLRSLFHTKG